MKLSIASLLLVTPSLALAAKIPETPVRTVTDEYHGVKVADPYRWLEDTQNSEVQSWTRAQAELAAEQLTKLPHYADIKKRFKEWAEFPSPRYGGLVYQGGVFFGARLQPPQNQAVLVRYSSLDDLKSEHVILDPNKLDSSGTTTMDLYVPSPDGKLVAVSISKAGSEIGTFHVYRTEDGSELPDQIEGVYKPTAGGGLAWNAKGDGFFYTRYPRKGERPNEDLDFYQQIYFHKLGTDPKNDTYELGKDFPRVAEIQLHASHDGQYVLATVANGDGGEFDHHLRNPDGTWTQLTKFSDQVKYGRFGHQGDLYMLSRRGAPKGKIIRLDLKNPKLAQAQVIVKEASGVVQDFIPAEKTLYVTYLQGGPTELKAFALNGKALPSVKTPPVSNVSDLEDAGNDTLIFRLQSYVQPSSWYTYSTRAKTPHLTALVSQSPVDFGDVEVRREMATSKDGTQVPISILYKKGFKKNGQSPTLLYAYGGYGISLSPRFITNVHLWLEHGGVYAIANIRGGGEFGDAWHLSGNLTKKQNVFDDFIAAAEYLQKSGYTNAEHMAIEGGSNGGLLMGAALTQRPDLFRAVVAHVGIFDMVRVEFDANGAFNITEFGTIKNPDHFKAIYAYSPYHHVKDGTAYPSVLLTTGANDGRVNPAQSKKMTARLQAASSSKNPILLSVTFDSGHGMGSSLAQRINDDANTYSFLFSQLGMKF